MDALPKWKKPKRIILKKKKIENELINIKVRLISF